MPTLSAEFSVEGSSAVQEHTVAYGATVDLAALSLSFRTIAWEISSSSKSGATAPAVTLAGTPLGATASFPQVADPGDGLGRAWLVKCTQTDAQGNQAVAYRVVGTVNARGRLPICADEENHRDATHGWSQSYNEMLSSEGTGDMAGPASSVSARLAVFSGTSGKNVADGGVSVADIGQSFNVLAYGAAPAASAATNTTAFTNAITAAKAVKGTVVVPEGTYALNPFAVTGGATFNIELRKGSTLDFTAATVPSATFCITIGQDADFVELSDIAANFDKYDQTVTFAVAPSLAAEDLYIVCDDDDFSWDDGDPTRPYYKKGDFCRVRSRSGVVVTNDRPACDTYLTTDNIRCLKLLTNTVRIFGGGTILIPDNASVTSGGIGIWNGYKCQVDDLIANGAKWAHVGLYRCYESEIRRLYVCNFSDISVERNYGVIMLSCYACHVKDSWIRVPRHCVTITGGSVEGTHPNRDCTVNGGTYRSDLIALDQHGAAENCSFLNLTCDGGMNIAGDHSTVDGCTLYDCPHATDFTGVALRVREDKGTNHTIKNTKLIARHVATGDDSLLCLLFGAPDRGGTISIKGIEFQTGSLAITQVAQIDLGGASSGRVSVDIDGVTGISELDAAPQFTVSCASTAKYDQISMRGCKGISPRVVASARLVTIDGVEVFGAGAAGVLVQLAAWPGGGQQQRIDIKNVNALRSTTSGINLAGPSSSEDIIATVSNCTSVNNGGDGSGSSSGRCSVAATGLKTVSVIDNPALGDTQGTQTQAFQCVVTSCATLRIWNNGQEGVRLVDSIASTTLLLTSPDMVAHVNSEDVVSAAQTAALDIPVLASTTVKYRVDVEAEDASGDRASVLALVRVTRSGSGTPPTPDLTVLQTTGATITLAATITGTSLRLRTTNSMGADAHITTQVREESKIFTVED